MNRRRCPAGHCRRQRSQRRQRPLRKREDRGGRARILRSECGKLAEPAEARRRSDGGPAAGA